MTCGPSTVLHHFIYCSVISNRHLSTGPLDFKFFYTKTSDKPWTSVFLPPPPLHKTNLCCHMEGYLCEQQEEESRSRPLWNQGNIHTTGFSIRNSKCYLLRKTIHKCQTNWNEDSYLTFSTGPYIGWEKFLISHGKTKQQKLKNTLSKDKTNHIDNDSLKHHYFTQQ